MTKTPKTPKTPKTRAPKAETPDEAPPKREPPIDANVERTAEQDRNGLSRKVRMFYDLQRLRLQSGGRTKPQTESGKIQLHEVDIAILERRSHELHIAERHALADVAAHLRTIPFYRDVLSDKKRFRGIGFTMAGVILSEFEIERQDTPSKMWAFAGLAPVAARRCRTCHAVVEPVKDESGFRHTAERARPTTPGAPPPKPRAAAPKCPTIISITETFESGRAQHPVSGQKLNYNAWLRAKLVGVLADVLIKVDSPWRAHYDTYKARKAAAGWGRSDAHRHAASKRFMIKMLLLEIWRDWRAFLGLPVREPYHVEFQGGHRHEPGYVGGTRTEAPGHEEDPEVAAEIEALEEVAP